MSPAQPATVHVNATVIEVLPSMGLAWLRDGDMRERAVTKSTPGLNLGELELGKTVCLHLNNVDGKLLPCRCVA